MTSRGMLTAGIVAMLMVAGQSAHGAIITVLHDQTNPLVVNTVPTAGYPGVGEEGYIFYSFKEAATATAGYNGPILSNLPSYVTIAVSNAGNRYTNLGNTNMTVDGIEYKTGALIANTVTMTLGAGVPDELWISLLVGNDKDNTQGNVNLTSPTASFADTTITYNDPTVPANEWVVFKIAGAVAGDQVRILSSSGNRLGGIAFDIIPEPATLGLLGIGGLLMVSRRRH